jgi:hypothetical protein
MPTSRNDDPATDASITPRLARSSHDLDELVRARPRRRPRRHRRRHHRRQAVTFPNAGLLLAGLTAAVVAGLGWAALTGGFP